jgi:hypothetical protein
LYYRRLRTRDRLRRNLGSYSNGPEFFIGWVFNVARSNYDVLVTLALGEVRR